MNLEILKKFVDDGIAKHKDFLDWKDAVDSAVSLTQHVQELTARAQSLDGYIAAGEDKISKAKVAIAEAEARAQTTLDTLAKKVVDANRDYENQIQALKVGIAENQSKLDNSKSRLESTIANEQDKVAKEFERLDSLQQAKVQSLKTQLQSWEDKLTAAKTAYDQFIANLPK